MRSVFDVANWFLSKQSMSPKKLQKMVYYAYAWGLTLFNDSVDELHVCLFNDDMPQAWIHGPVFPKLYTEYKKYGAQDIPLVNASKVPSFSTDEEDVLNQVIEVYGGFTANQLEQLTHQEMPWKNARGDCAPYDACTNLISNRDIYQCYSERLEA